MCFMRTLVNSLYLSAVLLGAARVRRAGRGCSGGAVQWAIHNTEE
jgi:hypothetical protein